MSDPLGITQAITNRQAAFQVAKALKGARDSVMIDKNVSDLLEHLITVQRSTVQSQKEHLALVQHSTARRVWRR